MTARLMLLSLACVTVSATADAQWTVTVKPTLDPLPAGFCAAVHLTVTDPVLRDIPRNPQGYRITMADFDMAMTSPSGAAVGQQIDASHWNACSCQGASVGTVATVTATYPAQALPASSRVPGVAIQQSATFTVAPPKGTINPVGCQAAGVAIASNTPPSASTPPASAPVPVNSGGGKTPGPVVPAITPVNPSGFTAVEIAPGQVKLSWQSVPGVNYYGLFGPGVANGGQQVFAGTTSFTATGVPPGMQQWSVGSYYMPGQISTGVGTFPTVSATVTSPPVAPPPAVALAGKYLVTMTALRAYQASMDDVLSRDGVGDEVYAAVYVRRYDRKTGTVVDFTSLQSNAYGDVNKFGTQRVQGGTRTRTGGIQDGDLIPSGSFAVTRMTPAQATTFPLKLWEGTLTDDVDALIITPSIWEQDGGTPLHDSWVQQQAALNISLFATPSVQNQITSKGFGALVSGAQGIGGGTWLGAQSKGVVDMALMHLGLPLATILSTSNDRPIGMLANGVDEAMLPNRAIVLTREIVEAALAQPALGPIPSPVQGSPAAMARIPVMATKPGIIMLQFEDRGMPGMFIFSERPAIYQMFVQVERVP